MCVVYVKNNESIDKALKRFKRKCNTEGIMDEMRKREFYEKPSDRKRRLLKRAIRKNNEEFNNKSTDDEDFEYMD